MRETYSKSDLIDLIGKDGSGELISGIFRDRFSVSFKNSDYSEDWNAVIGTLENAGMSWARLRFHDGAEHGFEVHYKRSGILTEECLSRKGWKPCIALMIAAIILEQRRIILEGQQPPRIQIKLMQYGDKNCVVEKSFEHVVEAKECLRALEIALEKFIRDENAFAAGYAKGIELERRQHE